jgi:tRNA 2-selenouridine synthase
VAIERIHIDPFLELSRHHLIIDVRSPAEYLHAHIPGAYNLPLFSNEERKIVGTTYKQNSREEAIKVGLDFFAPKMRKMVEEVEALIGNRQLAIGNKKMPEDNNHSLLNANCLLIYCWRGGMRSAGVAWLMDLYGFKVFTLAGGYKKFRNHVLDTFRLPFQLRIVGGYTGSGKTEVLKELGQRGEAVTDLENIAGHKGSAFGNIGMIPQPTQEMFENILALDLNTKAISNGQLTIGNWQWSKEKKEFPSPDSRLTTPDSRLKPIWLEDESQRIGQVNIPSDLWKTMRQSPVYFLDIPFEQRLDFVIREYGGLDQERMIEAIERIRQRLGGLEATNAINFLRENNTRESFRILLKYYDKWYLKALHNRDGFEALLTNVSCEEPNALNASKILRQPTYEAP